MGWFETLALKEYSKFPLNNDSNPPIPIYHFLIYFLFSPFQMISKLFVQNLMVCNKSGLLCAITETWRLTST